VPRGTLLWCALRHDALAEAHFDRPAAFDPTRWLADGAGEAKRVTMPFGAGPRICPGRYLALLEIKLALSMLLAHFDIGSVEAPGGGDPAEHMAFTMAPVGLRMRFTERA
jgi:cytochrome P450